MLPFRIVVCFSITEKRHRKGDEHELSVHLLFCIAQYTATYTHIPHCQHQGNRRRQLAIKMFIIDKPHF